MSDTTPAVSVAGYRWWIHLILLASYPVALGILGFISAGQSDEAMLPSDTAALIATCAVELVVFGAVFAVALVASGARNAELLLSWTGGRTIWRGLLYSLLLRGVIIVGTALIAIGAYVVSGGSAAALEHLRPEVENIIDARALEDPIYLLLTLTVVSFVVAGLREELWRAGMFAALAALFPWLFHTVGGRLGAAAMVAVVFGLGHLTQGTGGVLMTTALGFGLGWILLRHRSIWDAVFAHGFFNATTFAFLYALAR
jgi:membrane protease YdiL (CAAX protease family)